MSGDELDRELIVPLIKRAEPSGTGSSITFPDEDIPVADEFPGGLLITYVFDLPGVFRYVSAGDCERLGLAPGDLRRVAAANLTRRRARPQIKQGPAVAMFVLDGDLIAAVPARDILAVTGSQVPSGIDGLTRAIDRGWRASQVRRQLTKTLLVREGQSWSTFTTPP